MSTIGINNMFTPIADTHDRTTCAGQSFKLKVPKCNLAIIKANCHCRGATYYNEVPVEIKMSTRLDSFKREMSNGC